MMSRIIFLFFYWNLYVKLCASMSYYDSKANFNDCKSKYASKFTEEVLEDECREPLLYRFMRISLLTRFMPMSEQQLREETCLPRRLLLEQLQKDRKDATAIVKRDITVSIYYVTRVSGLTKKMEKRISGQHIYLTSPEVVINDEIREESHEFGIDTDSNIKDDFIIRQDNGISILSGWFVIPAFFPWNKGFENEWDKSDKINIIIYYDTKDSIWPNFKHHINLGKQIVHVSQYLLPFHAVHPGFTKADFTANIRNGSAPWLDEHLRGKPSLWCRGHRHLMALSDVVVKNYKGVFLDTYTGARFCSVYKKKDDVSILMYFNHVSKSMLEKGLGTNKDDLVTKPYGVSVTMIHKGTTWHPALIEIFETYLYKGKRDTDNLIKVNTDDFDFSNLSLNQTFYSRKPLKLDNIHSTVLHKLEVERIAIEYNPKGVGYFFTERMTAPTTTTSTTTTSTTVKPTTEEPASSVAPRSCDCPKPVTCDCGKESRSQHTEPYRTSDCRCCCCVHCLIGSWYRGH